MAILFGLVTALLWGASTLAGAPGARALGPIPALVWIELVGLALVLPFAIRGGVPDAPASAWVAAAGSGLAYVIGTWCWTLGITLGDVGIVTMLISTDGSVAALLAIALGEHVAGEVVGPLLLVTAGVVLATRGQRDGRRHVEHAAVLAGLGGALCFAVTFVAGGHAIALPTVWILLVARAAGCIVLLPYAAATHAFRSPRGVVWSLAGMAALDIGGYATYILAARHGIAIAAVLASQYALIAVLGARLVWGERLAPIQKLGVGVTLVGVALVALTR